MATINFSFVPQVGYTGDYRVIVYASSNPTVAVNQVDITPPFTNPIVGSLAVPTLEEHIMKVFALTCNKLVGQTNLTPPATQQIVRFENNFTPVGWKISEINIDAVNILAADIDEGNGFYNHPSNAMIAANPHNGTINFTGVPNGTNVRIRVFRGGVYILVVDGVYAGVPLPLVTGFSFQGGDIFYVGEKPADGNEVTLLCTNETGYVNPPNTQIVQGVYLFQDAAMTQPFAVASISDENGMVFLYDQVTGEVLAPTGYNC